MPADYGRIHRLLKILTLIQGDSTWTAQRLAQACAVTVRTIYRDMKMLEGAGIPYFHDTQTNGYQVRRDFFMPPVELTLDESLALIALGEHVADKEQIPLVRPAARAIAKVRSQLPGKIREDVEKLAPHVHVKLSQAGPHDGIADVYDLVRTAISEGRALQCAYDSVSSSSGDKPAQQHPFVFKPYALLFCQRAWYALGHHGGRDAVRCLKLNRFTDIAPTTLRYTIPKTFSVEQHMGNAWRMIRGSKTHNVELWFDASFAETIADTHWHPTQEIAYHDDGSITFRCRVDGLDEIVWWVLSMGPHCKVEKPAKLRQRVAKLAQQVAQQYA